FSRDWSSDVCSSDLFAMMEQVEDKMSEMQERIELKKAIYGENANLGDDDIMTSDAESAVSARKFVKDLSEHIEFPEDEQRKLDRSEERRVGKECRAR